MNPQEFWLLVIAHTPVKMYGKMTEHEVSEIYNRAYGKKRVA